MFCDIDGGTIAKMRKAHGEEESGNELNAMRGMNDFQFQQNKTSESHVQRKQQLLTTRVLKV